MPPQTQDVNVHPQKKEIRLKDKSSLYTWIFRAVETAFGRAEKVFSSSSFEEQAWDCSRQPPVPAFFKKSQDTSWESVVSSQSVAAVIENPKPVENSSFLKEEYWPLVVLGSFKTWAFLDKKALNGRLKPPYWSKDVPEQGLIVFDIKRARQKIEFEKLVENLQLSSQAKQVLLVPKTVKYLAHEALLVENALEFIRDMGISMRPFGPDSFIIEELGSAIDGNNLQDLVLSLADAFERESNIEEKKQREKIALLMLRHRKGQVIGASDVEIRYIFRSLMQLSSPYYSPKGGAIFGFIGESDFESLLSKPH